MWAAKQPAQARETQGANRKDGSQRRGPRINVTVTPLNGASAFRSAYPYSSSARKLLRSTCSWPSRLIPRTGSFFTHSPSKEPALFSELGPGDQRIPCTGADADCVAVPDITRCKPKVVVLFSAQELGAIGCPPGRDEEGVGLHGKGSTAGCKAETVFADSRR